MCKDCERLKHDILVMNRQLSEETLKRFEAEKKCKELKEILGRKM